MIEREEQDQKIVLCLPFRNAECFNLEMNCMLCIYEEKGPSKDINVKFESPLFRNAFSCKF